VLPPAKRRAGFLILHLAICRFGEGLLRIALGVARVSRGCYDPAGVLVNCCRKCPDDMV
jgi:hypothetical protein